MLRRPLVPVLLSFIAGILLSALPFNHSLAFIAFISGLAVLVMAHLVKPATRLMLPALLITFGSLGLIISSPTKPDPILDTLLKNKQRAKFEGTVVEVAGLQGQRGRFNVLVQRVYLTSLSKTVKWKVRLTVYRHVPQLILGQRILFSCIPRSFRNFHNPGCFDYESYMRHKGFVFSAAVSDGRRIVSLGKGQLPWPRNMVENLRRPLRDFFGTALRGDDLAIYSALLLGERHLITPELREKFTATGLSHVLAVSGLHIGLVGWLTFFLIKGLLSLSYRLSLTFDIKKLTALLTCIPIMLYVAVSGYQVSAVRAMIMALAFLWSVILAKEKDIWSTLCLSALVILSIQPEALFHVSFQLSYLAVIGLIWLCPPLFKVINPWLDRAVKNVPSYIGRACYYLVSLGVITLTAFFFLLPVNLYYFHRIPLLTFLANFAVVPILGLLVIPCGLISALLYLLSPFGAKAVLLLGLVGLHGILHIVNFLSQIPLSSIWFVTPNWLEMGLFYALIFLGSLWGRGRWVKMAFACLCLVALADTGYWIGKNHFNKDMRISFLDVGHGNCALVEMPGGKKMLVDGGGSYSPSFDIGRMVVAPFLWWRKILKVDYLVLTHPQADHMDGLRFIARAFNPKLFFYNGQQSDEQSFKELMAVLHKKRVKIVIPKYPVDRLLLGNVIATFFSASPFELRPLGHGAINNCSLVLKLTHGCFSVLFPGDIERGRELLLAREIGRGLRSQILLSPHHGSITSNLRIFLQAVNPKLCIISCREGGRFKFPDKKVLQRLRALGCTTVRTDKDGMVQVTVHSGIIKAHTFATHKRINLRLTSCE